MEFKLIYQILSSVGKSKTISDIANKLYLSQPYISQLLAKAERQYKVKLINRKQVPISLTPAGFKLKDDLKKVIDDQQKINQDLQPFKSNNQTFIKLVITPLWIRNLTSKIIEQLQSKFPDIQFEIQQIFTSEDSIKLLENHNIDIFWGALLHDDSIKSKYLYQSKACILLPATNSLYERNITYTKLNYSLLNQLNNSKLVSLTDNSAFQKIVDHMFEDYGIKMNKIIKVNDYIGASQLAIDGLGITVTLTDTLKYLNLQKVKFNIIEIPSNMINLDVGISINKSSSSPVKKIAEQLYKIINQYNLK